MGLNMDGVCSVKKAMMMNSVDDDSHLAAFRVMS